MSEAITLLAVIGIALLGVSAPRLASKQRLERRLYRHVDEPLGARRFENDRRASLRRALEFFSRDLANLLYPSTQFGGVAVLPSAKRIRRYVQLDYSPVPWPRRYRAWHVQVVTLRWTSEANALGEGFGTLLTRKVAQALILSSGNQLEQHPAFEKGYFQLRRSKPATVVPTSVPFGEATDE